MYQRILVPVDGSLPSERALGEAIRLGQLTGARLRLVYVVDGFSLSMVVAGAGGHTGALLEVLRNTGREVLKQGEARVKAAGLLVDSVLCNSFQSRIGDLVLAQANEWKADLIALGSHGRRGVGLVQMGSDAESILRNATVPVLLLRVGKEAAPGLVSAAMRLAACPAD